MMSLPHRHKQHKAFQVLSTYERNVNTRIPIPLHYFHFFQLLTELLYNRPFFPNTKYENNPLQNLCKMGAITQGHSNYILFQIGGFNPNQLNQVSGIQVYNKC